MMQLSLFDGEMGPDELRQTIIENHYLHSVPSGKSLCFQHKEAIVMFSIPANPYISQWLVGESNAVWELSRLWAPDGHDKNLLSEAISASVKRLRHLVDVEAVVSYADPAAGHHGGVYRAASWVYLGRTEDLRAYYDADGNIVARRKFHSGNKYPSKEEMLNAGFRETRGVGKERFGRGLTRKARAAIRNLVAGL